MAKPKLSVTSPPATDADPNSAAMVESLDVCREEKTVWLLPTRFREGCLNILEGDTSVGKSVFLAGLAAAVTTAAPFLGRTGRKPSCVLWLTSEGNYASDIRPLIAAAGGFVPSVKTPAKDDLGERHRFTIPGSLSLIRDIVAAHGISLVVVEPLMSHISEGYDIENGPDARAILDPVQRFTMATGVTFVLTRGLRKDRTGPRTLHGAGSATVGDTVRCISVIDQPDKSSETRYLHPVKTSGTAFPPSLRYEIVVRNGAAVMTNFVALSSAEAAASESPPDLTEKTKRADAEALLRNLLAKGPVSAESVKRHAEAAMISSTTIFAARQALGITSRRHGFGSDGYFEWEAPAGGFPRINGGTPAPSESMESMRKTRKKRSGKSIDSIDSASPGSPPK